MDFKNIFDFEWGKNAGTEPSNSLKQSGFTGGYKPPAGVFNWFFQKFMAGQTELQGAVNKIETNVSSLSANKVNAVQSLANGTDLNTVTTSGFYRMGTDHVNAPTNTNWSQLIVVHGGGDTIGQILIEYSANKMYVRSGNPTNVGGTGAWGDWVLMYSAKHKPTPDDVSAVSLNGGTNIPKNSDLNTYRTAGNYHCSGDADAQSLSNCPATNAFRMRVGYPTGGPSYLYQEIINWTNGTRYYRQCLASSNTWTNWVKSYDSNSLTASAIKSLINVLPVANGGTGANNANGAVANLLGKKLINNSEIVNANTLTATGIHKVYLTDATLAADNNYPYVYGNMVVINNMEGTSYAYVMQQFFTTDGKVYNRASTNNGSTWTEWKKMGDDEKPSGSYVGNGQNRTIDIGGSGNILLVLGEWIAEYTSGSNTAVEVAAFVTNRDMYAASYTGNHDTSGKNVFKNGVLTLKGSGGNNNTVGYTINSQGKTYYYYVL